MMWAQEIGRRVMCQCKGSVILQTENRQLQIIMHNIPESLSYNNKANTSIMLC